MASLPGLVGEIFLRVPMLPQDERVAPIGRLYQDPNTRSPAGLLVDLEDRQLSLDIVQALKNHAGGIGKVTWVTGDGFRRGRRGAGRHESRQCRARRCHRTLRATHMHVSTTRISTNRTRPEASQAARAIHHQLRTTTKDPFSDLRCALSRKTGLGR